MNTSSSVAWCVVRCVGSRPARGERGQQGGHRAVHLAHGQPTARAVTAHTARRSAASLQHIVRESRGVVDAEFDHVLGAQRA